MDWARAIERNSEALKGIVEALFAMLGLAGAATVARIPQPLHRARAAPAAARRIRRAPPCGHCGARPCGEAGALAAHAGGANHREGRELTSLVSALRSAQEFRRSAPQNIHAESSAHPYLRKRSPGGGPVDSTPALSRSRCAARWPRQCRAPQPQAARPQVRARGSAAPGPASRPLAGEARDRKSSKVQVAAAAGPSARLPQESNSRSRCGAHRMPWPRL
jgi:hypothetical protein